MSEPRAFELADILSVTTRKMLSRKNFTGILELLTFLTGITLKRASAAYAAELCREQLFLQYPKLAAAVADYPKGEHEEWLKRQEVHFGVVLNVVPVSDPVVLDDIKLFNDSVESPV